MPSQRFALSLVLALAVAAGLSAQSASRGGMANEDANAWLPRPLTLDYELNDPADTESIYTRSDHYSYASIATQAP